MLIWEYSLFCFIMYTMSKKKEAALIFDYVRPDLKS